MPGYIDTILQELKHPTPRKPQHSPHPHVPIQYGTAPQLAQAPDESQPLDTSDNIQPSRIIGKLLYSARAVDSTLSVALSLLASEQNKPTVRTKRNIPHLLDYCATHPDARVRFHASEMILHLHSDAGYDNKTKARSCSGGHFYLGHHPSKPAQPNGAILNPTHILKHVASSTVDAEIWSNLCELSQSHTNPPDPVRYGTFPTTDTCHTGQHYSRRVREQKHQATQNENNRHAILLVTGSGSSEKLQICVEKSCRQSW